MLGGFNFWEACVTHILPEGKENDKLNTCDFQEKLFIRKGLLQLIIKLDEAVHCNRHGDGVETKHPDMGKPRA
jgi:hypothetical protein